MSKGADRGRAGRASRWLLPPAASIAVHAGLVIALAAVTIEVTRDRTPARASKVTLAAPPPTVVAGASRVEPGDVPANAAPVRAAEPAALREAVAAAGTPGPAAAAPVQLAPTPGTRSLLETENAGSPRVRFAEIDAAPARTVVFVVDASGAVASAFTFVREELLRSIDQLSPTQRFQVVVFPGPENSDPVLAPINRGRLALATPGAKRAVGEWMAGFRPRGQSRPLEGLRRALALKPDIALLITRSIERTGPDAAWGSGIEATMAELDGLNPIDRRTGERRSVIAAVQLLDEDPTGIMSAITAGHGQGLGDYRVVTAETLASPRERLPRAAGATNAASIDAAATVLAELDDTGTALRITHGLPDSADLDRADDLATRAIELAARTPNDPRARVLIARARTLTRDTAGLDAAAGTLGDELLHDPDADAWRRLALIDALTLAAKSDDARAEMSGLRADALELPLSRALRARIVVTAASLGEPPADLEQAVQSAPFVDDAGMTDPYWVLALAEAVVRSRLDEGGADAFGPLLSLLERAEREGADTWPPILIDRMARAAARRPEAAMGAQPRVRLEVALAWSRSPATQDRARALLGSLTVPGAPHRAEALWRLGVLERSLNTPGSNARAADLLATLATEHAEDPRSGDAIAAAVALTTEPGRLRTLLAHAVMRVDRPEIDLWRLQLAPMLPPAARLDTLQPVAPGTRESTLARALYADAAETLYADPGTDHGALAARAALYLSAHQSPEAAVWFGRAAEHAPDAEAAVDLARRASAAAARSGRDTTETDLTLARALVRAGSGAEAAGILAPLATRLDAANDRTPRFWEAWTLLLESAHHTDAEAARAHLARLSLIDPGLGGPPWSERLELVRNAVIPTQAMP